MKNTFALCLFFLLIVSKAKNSDLDGYCGYDHMHYNTIEDAHRNDTKF
jgi:hypothetical protein